MNIDQRAWRHAADPTQPRRLPYHLDSRLTSRGKIMNGSPFNIFLHIGLTKLSGIGMNRGKMQEYINERNPQEPNRQHDECLETRLAGDRILHSLSCIFCDGMVLY